MKRFEKLYRPFKNDFQDEPPILVQIALGALIAAGFFALAFLLQALFFGVIK